MKKFQQKFVLIVVISVIMIMIPWDLSAPNQDPTQIASTVVDSDQSQAIPSLPFSAQSGTWDLHLVDEPFNTNPFSSRWTNQDVDNFAQTSGYIYVSATQFLNPNIDAIAQCSTNLVGTEPIYNANITVEWDANFEGGPSEYAKWQYQIDGGSWTDFGGVADNSNDFDRETITFNLDDANLDGTEVSLYIRVVTEFSYGSGNNTLRIYDVSVGVLTATISDNSGLSGEFSVLGTDLDITVNIRRFGTESGLTNTVGDYDIFYSFSDSNPDENDNIATASGSFSGDSATLTYTITAPSVNDTVYYRLGIFESSNTYYYYSQVYSVDWYDGTNPSIGDYEINGNATYYYYEDLTVTVDLTDTGGMHLSFAEIYWAINDNSPSHTNYDGTDSDLTLTGDSDTASFDIPSSDIYASVNTYFIVYVYDGSYNLATSSVYAITPEDDNAPTLTYTYNSTVDDEVEFDEIMTLRFNATEDMHGSGIASGNDGLIVYYKIGSTPINNANYDGSITTTHSNPFSIEPTFIVDIASISTLDSSIFFWAYSEDVDGNPISTWDTAIEFLVVDTSGPDTDLVSMQNMNYSDSQILQFRVLEKIGASGVDLDTVKCYFRINSPTTTFNPAESTLLPNTSYSYYTDGTDEGGIWGFTFDGQLAEYADVVFIWINGSDEKGNPMLPTEQYMGQFVILDQILPTIESSTNALYSNTTYARTFYDLSLAFLCDDGTGGSGIKNLTFGFIVGNVETTLSWNEIGAYYLGADITSTFANGYQIVIDREDLTSGILYYLARTYDIAGNYVEIGGYFEVVDQNTYPLITNYAFGDTTNEWIDTDSFDFSFEILNNSLMYVSLDGTLQNNEPYQGTSLTHSFSGLSEGEHTIRVQYFNLTKDYLIHIDLTAPSQIAKSTISISYGDQQIHIAWSAPAGSESESLQYYIYRGSTPNFAIEDGILFDSTSQTSIDYNFNIAGEYYFKIIAQDAAGNQSPPSESVSLVVPKNNTLIYIIVAACVAGIAALIVMKKRNAAFAEADSDNTRGKKEKESLWEDGDEEDLDWKSIGHEAMSQKIQSQSKPIPKPAVETHPAQAKAASGGLTTTAGRPLTQNEILSMFDSEMRELYDNAQDFIDFGQESMAAKSYDALMRLAEKQNDSRVIRFIKAKIDELYK